VLVRREEIMTKIEIISGFLGAGKTTLIKKLIEEAFKGEKLVLIENEFGEIGIDGGFLKEAGVEINEMNSGCICCSLVGDFGEALQEVLEKFAPDRIIIEPSGVGKLSDVIKAVENVAEGKDVLLNSYTTVVDAKKSKMYMKNFGEFFNNQVENAKTIVLSRTDEMDGDKLEAVVSSLKEHNDNAILITTPWNDITGEKILEAMEDSANLEKELIHEHNHHHHHEGECCCGHDHDHHGHHHEEGECCCEHDHDHHGHHHEEGECCCGHDHDHHGHHHEEGECCCGHDHDHHGHHHEEGECCCGHDHDHHGHHHEEGECCCGHHHDHHGHHHADEVFTSWGEQTTHKYSKDELEKILEKLANSNSYGVILRAKGIVSADSGVWYHFDLVPGEYEVREGAADYTGRLCVIGTDLKEADLKELFGVR